MKHEIDAIYENGAFRPIQPPAAPLREGQQVRLIVDDESALEALGLATRVYEGLSEREIDEIEQIALDRGRFFDAADSSS